jgi:membrane fusion protein (multidrug efflux system)
MVRRIALGVFLGALVVVVGCGGRGDEDSETVKAVVVGTPEVRVMRQSLRLLGEVEAAQKAALSFPMSGIIAEMNADIGDTVAKGQVLARLRQEEFRARLEQASAAYEKAKKDLAKVEQLFEEELTSEDRLEGARLSVKQTHAAYVMANETLRNSAIKAPFDGVVSQKSGEPSEMYSAMMGPSAVYSVVDASSVKVRLGIPSDELGRVQVGYEGLFSVSAYDDRKFRGRLKLVGVEVDMRSRTATGELLVPNPNGLLKPGMVGEAEILVSEPREVVALPEAALLDDLGLSYVLAYSGGTVLKRQVELGTVENGWTEIVGGLGPGDTVVVEGQFGLREGQTVRILDAAEAAGDSTPPE